MSQSRTRDAETLAVNQVRLIFLRWLSELGQVSILAYQTLYYLLRPPVNAFPLLIKQLATVGVDSLPVVLLTGIFTGMVLTVQGYHQLAELAASGMVGGFVGLSVLKELGPMMTAFVLAGRIGASITAELGTMRVTEQIDALQVMATHPVRYLVVPRFLACVIMLPVLTMFSNVFGIIGGYATAVWLFGVNGTFFLNQVRLVIFTSSIFIGLVKAMSFGIIIAIIACHRGFSIQTAGGAEGVGKATTGSAVQSLVLILVMDFFLNHLLYTVLGLR